MTGMYLNDRQYAHANADSEQSTTRISVGPSARTARPALQTAVAPRPVISGGGPVAVASEASRQPDEQVLRPLPPMPVPPLPAVQAPAAWTWRIRWDNIAIAAIILTAVVISMVWLTIRDSGPRGATAVATAAANDPAAADSPAPTTVPDPEMPAGAAAPGDTSGLQRAMSMMSHARDLVSEGRLDEAEIVLYGVELDYTQDVRADELLNDVTRMIARRNALERTARQAIDAGQPAVALRAIKELATFSRLPADLAAAKVDATRELAIRQKKRSIQQMIDRGDAAGALDAARAARDAYGSTFNPLVSAAKRAMSGAGDPGSSAEDRPDTGLGAIAGGPPQGSIPGDTPVTGGGAADAGPPSVGTGGPPGGDVGPPPSIGGLDDMPAPPRQ